MSEYRIRLTKRPLARTTHSHEVPVEVDWSIVDDSDIVVVRGTEQAEEPVGLKDLREIAAGVLTGELIADAAGSVTEEDWDSGQVEIRLALKSGR